MISQLVLLITTRCNLRCRLCYLDQKEPQDISREIIFRALDLANPKDLQEIVISGGEPLLRPDLVFAAIQYARTRFGNAVKISIQTNGTLINTDIAQKLDSFKVGIGISIDGPPETNEKLRGETNSLVGCLNKLGTIGKSVGVTVTLSRYNASSLYRLVIFLSNFPCVMSIGIDPLRPVGRAKTDDIADITTIADDLEKMKKTLDWINHKRQTPLTLREAVSPAYSKPYCHACTGSLVTVHPDGSLWPCPSLVKNKRFKLGSVDSHKIKSLALNKLDKICDPCTSSPSCHGRCPVRTWLSPAAGLIDCMIRRVLLGITCRSMTPEITGGM